MMPTRTTDYAIVIKPKIKVVPAKIAVIGVAESELKFHKQFFILKANVLSSNKLQIIKKYCTTAKL